MKLTNIKDVREVIFNRDNNECYYCGSSNELHLDHIYPKILILNHSIDNIITSCKECNLGKGAKILPLRVQQLIYTNVKERNLIFSKLQRDAINEILEGFFNWGWYDGRNTRKTAIYLVQTYINGKSVMKVYPNKHQCGAALKIPAFKLTDKVIKIKNSTITPLHFEIV